MILIHKSVPFAASETIADPNGRFVIVVGRLHTSPVILACVYAPNWDDFQFMYKFLSSIPHLDTHQLILSGDFNCVINPLLDKSSNKMATKSKTSECTKSFLKACAMADPWQSLFPTKREYSFFSPVHHTFSRIDYFFLDKTLLPWVQSCTYNSIVISDHAPLRLKLAFSNCRPG